MRFYKAMQTPKSPPQDWSAARHVRSASGNLLPGGQGRPVGLLRDYDRTELIADGTVHAIGLTLACIATFYLTAEARQMTNPVQSASVCAYCVSLIGTLSLSAAYNLWPVNAVKWLLRRCDQSGIYVMIVATFTPFIVHERSNMMLSGFPVTLWLISFVGVVTSFTFRAYCNSWSVIPYLALGSIGLLTYAPVLNSLPGLTILLISFGGILYVIGVVFHLWQSMRFQCAIWHGFVVAAAGCHCLAVASCNYQSIH